MPSRAIQDDTAGPGEGGAPASVSLPDDVSAVEPEVDDYRARLEREISESA